MRYSGDLLQINGMPVKKLISYKVQYNKLWGQDSGRNLAGVNKGTLIGIFPKIILEIGSMDEYEMETFLAWTDLPEINVTYYDARYRELRTASYYSNSPEASLKNKNTMKYDRITINLIPNQKRA